MSLPAKEAMLAQVGKFTHNFTLLTLPNEVKPEDGVPETWVEMLRSQETGKKTWAEPWEPYRELLPCVLDFLEHKVHGVCVLLEQGQPPSLLYFFSSEGEDYYYEGGPPLGETVTDDPRRVWARLPPKLQAFYRNVHNGWTTISFMGPLPVEDIEFLSDYDWGDDETEELNAQLPFRLENAAMVFNNGGGDSLCLDLSLDAPEDHAFAWWHEETLEPMLDINFWDLMDGWICGQLEDVDLADQAE